MYLNKKSAETVPADFHSFICFYLPAGAAVLSTFMLSIGIVVDMVSDTAGAVCMVVSVIVESVSLEDICFSFVLQLTAKNPTPRIIKTNFFIIFYFYGDEIEYSITIPKISFITI
ncbi:hypothetical protein AR686_16325 [Chryseobacterium aquaticum subsp. greenlandense]|uniref:Uncharacterized protein n=1 Tax=Chryseobacterium aquaticum subsp. greenlandense TaxID=345663 RepID=A0A117KB34_9FLAO|nr:hypothetical protein AR686_16325 [Chryseobacterium aquaticum subsp. greenlandense]